MRFGSHKLTSFDPQNIDSQKKSRALLGDVFFFFPSGIVLLSFAWKKEKENGSRNVGQHGLFLGPQGLR